MFSPQPRPGSTEGGLGVGGGGWGGVGGALHLSTGHCYSRRQHGDCHNGAAG